VKIALPVVALALLGTLFGPAVAEAQTQDSSQDGLLKGNFQFRHVAVLEVDEFSNPNEIEAIYGTINFDGAGHYTISGTTVNNTVLSGAPQPLTETGTYAIGSNGAGYVANPIFPTDPNAYVYGAVSQGVYTGSSTEVAQEGLVLNDIFIAIPAGAAPTNASFTSSYQTGLLDFAGGGSTAIKNALFELTPNGQGKFGTIALSGQASNANVSSLTQSVAGATYNFSSNGSATLTIPLPSGVRAPAALFTGSKTLFESSDGKFILGWTPGGYDIFFGVIALTTPGTNTLSAGLYFTSALEDSPESEGTDSYYGAISNFGDSAGDGVVHERTNIPEVPSYDFGTSDQIVLSSNGTAGPDYNDYDYIFGDTVVCPSGASTVSCAAAFVAIGTGGKYTLLVGLRAPVFSGPGVYLNPIGVVNAASYQPVTASLAPGELITLFGTGLSPVTMTTQGGQVFPAALGGVKVTINSIPCPIYYVSSTQLAVIVPYGVASNQTGLANIQVNNSGTLSNVVQMYLTDAAPGAFSQETTPVLMTQSGQPSIDGIGYGAILHAATGALVTPANPAQPLEYISVFLTGLGPVTPAINDGALGPSNPLSWADVYEAYNLTVYFNDYTTGSLENAGDIQFAGLAPGLAGLYQINIQVPADVLGSGDDVYIEFETDAADVDQIEIPYGDPAGNRVAAKAPRAKASPAAAIQARRSKRRRRPA
jgi:uncharacterized protein (TIGR03437 family)